MIIGTNTQQGDRGHHWRTNDDGSIDTFAMSYEFHNGPVCVNCGYSYCHHCDGGPQEDCTAATIEGECTRVDNQRRLDHERG